MCVYEIYSCINALPFGYRCFKGFRLSRLSTRLKESLITESVNIGIKGFCRPSCKSVDNGTLFSDNLKFYRQINSHAKLN